jgi:hypothetical protein
VKIHFALIEAASLQGSQTSNPFGFYRSWEVEKNFGASAAEEIRACHLVDEVTSLKRLFIEFMRKQQNTEQQSENQGNDGSGNQGCSSGIQGPPPPSSRKIKGKQPLRGRGRGAKNLRPRPAQRQSFAEIIDDDEEVEEDGSENSYRSAHSNSEMLAEQARQAGLTVTETVYVKRIQLELNSDPLDQFQSDCTADECPVGKNLLIIQILGPLRFAQCR